MSNYDIWWFIQPSHLLLWLLLATSLLTLVNFKHRRRARTVRAALAVSVALLFIAAFSPLGTLLILPLEERFASPPPDAAPPPGVIVLAGAEQVVSSHERGLPQLNGFADRLTVFMMLAQRYPQATLVHCGRGSEEQGTTQSSIARDVLQGTLPDRRVVYEDVSADTHGGAAEIARMREAGALPDHEHWWLVTSAFHMPERWPLFAPREST